MLGTLRRTPVLKSGVKGNFHAPFGIGRGRGDPPPDRHCPLVSFIKYEFTVIVSIANVKHNEEFGDIWERVALCNSQRYWIRYSM